MAALLKFLPFIWGLINPVIKENKGTDLPTALKVNWLKMVIVGIFILSSGYYIFVSEAPLEERQQQLEMIEDMTEDAIDMMDESTDG